MQNLEGFYEIDLTKSPDSTELVNNVVYALESCNRKDSSIKLKLGSIQMNQSQMIFIKSLLESYGFDLEIIETSNSLTKDICAEMGIQTMEYVEEIPKEPLNMPDFMQENMTVSNNVENQQEQVQQPQPQAEEQAQPEIKVETPEQPAQEQQPVQTPQENKDEATLARLNELREQFKNKYESSIKSDNFPKEEKTNDKEQEIQDKEQEKQNTETKSASSRLEERMKLLEAMKRNKEEIHKTPKEAQKQTIGVYRKADEAENSLEFQEEDVDFYATPTDAPVVIDTKKTIYVNQTLRSGQVLEYDGNIVIIGDCHPGSEIKATGDITVWGVLGSIAHAGAKGNTEARIRALKLNAVQLRIANCYSRRPDSGNIPYVVKSAVFIPEEARIVDDNIVLFKLAQN